MDILEVYALNVQPSQINALLTIDDRKKATNIQKEREHFLRWLREMYETKGARFESQLEAWNTYMLYIEFDLFDHEDEEVSWQAEIEEILDGQVRAKNYNEFGGQA